MSVNSDELYGRLQWLMFLRVVVATFLLGATVLLQVRETESLLTPHLLGLYGLIATTYLLTLLYVLLLKQIHNLKVLAYGQITVDLLLVTVLVYLTGLEESVFSSIYNLSIITGSILLYRRGGLMAASLSSLLYGGLLDLRYYGASPTMAWAAAELPEGVGGEIFYTILMNISAFFLVALLSSYLAEQARISQKELEETQSDLSELTATHENILQCLHSGLITADLQGRITFANHATQEITGTDLDEIVGRPLSSMFSQLPMEALRDLPSQPLPPRDRRSTMDFQCPDGRQIHLGFTLAPLRSVDGNRTGTIIHFQDLTQTIAMEEHIRRVDRLATIGEMAARISHEIRNPLASLSGSIQILQDELHLDGPDRRLMEIVMRETQRLNALLTDFLLYARPEKLQIEEMDLSHALQETLDLFMEREKRGPPIEVISDIAPSLIVKADPKKVRQIIWNLFNNAVEAMPNGGRLKVRAHTPDPLAWPSRKGGVSWLLLEIEDTGVGIPPENLERIYNPFFTTKDRGTGLGLSTVHRSVEDLGGWISVRSELDKGTRFTLWIPSQPMERSAEVERARG